MLRAIIKFLKGVIDKMFKKTTLKKVIGEDVQLSDSMITKLEEWNDMLVGKAKWCTSDDGITSLGIESEICKEFTNVCLSEMTAKVTGNDKLDEIFQKAIKNLNENLQDGLALGSMVIKPLGNDEVEYIRADNIIPIEYNADGLLKKCAFIQSKKINDKEYYHRVEFHLLGDNGLTIMNKAYKGKKSEINTQISLEMVEEWANLPEEVNYPLMDKIDFGYYRNPIPNRIDRSFTGVSIFDNSIENIKKADIQNARLDYEFESAERAVFADWTAVETRKNTDGRIVNKIPQRRKRLFVGVDVNDALDTFNPEIRESNYINGLNEYLRRIELTSSLAYGDLSKNETVEKTATEILASKKRKYNMVNAIESNLKDCLQGLVDGLAFHNGMYTTNYEFICDFKDSILTDENTERLQDRQDVAMGVMSAVEYRMKWYAEDEKTARKNLPVLEPDVLS